MPLPMNTSTNTEVFFCTNNNFTKRRAHLRSQNDLNFQNRNVTRKTTAKGKLIYKGAFVINTNTPYLSVLAQT